MIAMVILAALGVILLMYLVFQAYLAVDTWLGNLRNLYYRVSILERAALERTLDAKKRGRK